jgi:hypothetical protein
MCGMFVAAILDSVVLNLHGGKPFAACVNVIGCEEELLHDSDQSEAFQIFFFFLH